MGYGRIDIILQASKLKTRQLGLMLFDAYVAFTPQRRHGIEAGHSCYGHGHSRAEANTMVLASS